MIISKPQIIAVANMYTVEQLQSKIVELIQDIETNGSTITSATTGSGASYSRRIEAGRLELLDLYQASLSWKLNGDYDAPTGYVAPVQFNAPFNR